MLRARILRVGQRLIERGAWYLAPFSWLYALAVIFRNKAYDWGLFPVTRVDAVVVSVGNIVAGGTGKTPFVHRLASAFPNQKVAILSRGYGEIPDEAILLAKKLPHVQVLIGKNRAQLARQTEADLLILDDGFQHRKLYRDFDLVLVNEKKERYLPWGFLRDEPRRLKEAEVFSTADLKLQVKRIMNRKGEEIPSIQGWKVGIFCGIAYPERFKKTVEELGAEIVTETYFGDHEIADLSKLPKGNALICTEKDFVKLGPTELPIYFLEMEMEIVRNRDKWENLIEKINRKLHNEPTYE